MRFAWQASSHPHLRVCPIREDHLRKMVRGVSPHVNTICCVTCSNVLNLLALMCHFLNSFGKSSKQVDSGFWSFISFRRSKRWTTPVAMTSLTA